MIERLVELSAAGQEISEVDAGQKVVGLDFQGLAVLRDGLVDLSACGQRNCEVVVSLEIVGLDFQGPGNGQWPPRIVRGRPAPAKVLVGLDEVGLDFQGRLVMGDGLVELSAAGQTQKPRFSWASAESGLISRAFW